MGFARYGTPVPIFVEKDNKDLYDGKPIVLHKEEAIDVQHEVGRQLTSKLPIDSLHLSLTQIV